MAVCYFNNDYENQYSCKYEKAENGIQVFVEYDVHDEIEAINGVKIYGSNTKFKDRDILIIDSKKKINYLLKDTYYSGSSSILGTPDGEYITNFSTNVYFIDSDYNNLCELPKTPKVKKIKIYSNFINDLIGYPSLTSITNDDNYIIKLNRESQKQFLEINKNGIKSVTIGDSWKSTNNTKKYNIQIDFKGYIELELTKRVDYENISEFIMELTVFMQLLIPNKFKVDKIQVMVEDKYYGIFLPLNDMKYSDKYAEPSIKINILEFIKSCYCLIPYRNSKTEIRNIPYIILKTARNLEDNFLMFYRFIECYYKKQKIENIKTSFISYSIKNNYKKSSDMIDEEIENLAQEIVCLRNKYVHSGYYIKNSSLKITFKQIKKRKNPKNYTANNVDVHWIYERTQILYKIVIDIIFSNILNYDNYRFEKHF